MAPLAGCSGMGAPTDDEPDWPAALEGCAGLVVQAAVMSATAHAAAARIVRRTINRVDMTDPFHGRAPTLVDTEPAPRHDRIAPLSMK